MEECAGGFCDLESLRELVALWVQGRYDGPEEYSKGFLAGTIIADLGRWRRWVDAQDEEAAWQRRDPASDEMFPFRELMRSMVEEAETLLQSDLALAKSGLKSLGDAKTFYEKVKFLVKQAKHPSADGYSIDLFTLNYEIDYRN